jgi:hypothetical protein
MKLPRRHFLHLAAGAAALPAISRIAWAEDYPTKPVRLVVGFPAGQTADIIVRLMGQWLSERLCPTPTNRKFNDHVMLGGLGIGDMKGSWEGSRVDVRIGLVRQYSSASMIVMTRRVTAGSDGSGEWYVRF